MKAISCFSCCKLFMLAHLSRIGRLTATMLSLSQRTSHTSRSSSRSILPTYSCCEKPDILSSRFLMPEDSFPPVPAALKGSALGWFNPWPLWGSMQEATHGCVSLVMFLSFPPPSVPTFFCLKIKGKNIPCED